MSELRSKKGRPSVYNSELAQEICNTIASSSKGTKKLCAENPHWPCQDTLFTWLKTYTEFSEQYAKAKRSQIEVLVDEILEIADDSSQDILVNEEGKEIYNSEKVARSRLRIDTRKWLACKLVPRVYGVKPEDTHTNHESSLKQLMVDVERYKEEMKDY